LPADFPAPIAVVQHLDPRYRSLMAQILGRKTHLLVREAATGQRAEPGVVYVAPPDHHLLIEPDGAFVLTRSELVHFVRPSIDLLFESLAGAFRERAVAVILTGSGSDGAAGVSAIKRMGGTVIVQDEKSAEFSGMPMAAQQAAPVDLVLALEEIAPALRRVVGPRASR
jgi:two-component system chemotaxis response regulator CheB